MTRIPATDSHTTRSTATLPSPTALAARRPR
jgi:hypothetical protein